ncbi:outer membrane lipoprotein chaperone LolA [Pusillimonas noertemannii]|uniref:Outer-membrane lipoprotein carrier protein n=1 Tax=Pusillimonas noertemannii TaxID=305977 RepID=A0A2U1CRN0_9BURK|nr:outer membrane lipoprotein chaperone LolA [Pusillimonas noertemannii]NYT67892.1 outer membrane lipoprotein chaperone LolA [Pusillimonas noertemannii]PVY68562.1 outer membrane lipoprotein carrier protein [Pusillimonas noertemannii]TFL11964.1 outer membrane lipoprotein chaperone LolA [Pusillimonas noertemannii]
MQIKQLVAAAALVLAPLAALAADAPTQLNQFIANVASATGSFSQQTSGQAQGRPEQSGEFSFQRPGKFRWHVKKPYEQLIVSDGEKVLQYDPDLAQVTQRSVDQSIGTSPAAILFGSGSLEEAFVVQSLPGDDGLQWLRATPRGADAGFSHVDIGFRNDLPARLLLLDAFGQTTRIDLSGIKANPELPASLFQFTPPADVDVVKMQ